jgi:transposase-like protein
MKYSTAFRANILKKVLPPENRSVLEVSKENGISTQTIYTWLKRAKDGTLEASTDRMRPGDRSIGEKFTLLLEGKSVDREKHGEWLRSQGLHTEHLHQWEQELREAMTDGEKKKQEKIKQLEKEKKELTRELARKEKALAEMAALMTLKKKADNLWGDNEDD